MSALPRHGKPEEFEACGNRWTVDLAPCDPKVRLTFHGIEAEVHYDDALLLASALVGAVEASRLTWAARDKGSEPLPARRRPCRTWCVDKDGPLCSCRTTTRNGPSDAASIKEFEDFGRFYDKSSSAPSQGVTE